MRTRGNLDHRGLGDIDTLTVREFLAQSRWRRILYRLYRHPHGDVWRRSHVPVHLEASIAGRDDAWWLEALAEYNGHQYRHRGSRRRGDLAGRLSGHSCLCICRSPFWRRRSVSGCSTSSINSRTRYWSHDEELEFSRSCAAWQFPLPFAGCLAMVHGQYRHPPHPSSQQSEFPAIDCRMCCAIIRSSLASDE